TWGSSLLSTSRFGSRPIAPRGNGPGPARCGACTAAPRPAAPRGSRDRGRKDRLVSAPPPSEPCRRISRTRLSSQWFGLITSKRIDRPVHGPLLSYTALELQRRHSASDDDLNRDHVLCDRCV